MGGRDLGRAVVGRRCCPPWVGFPPGWTKGGADGSPQRGRPAGSRSACSLGILACLLLSVSWRCPRRTAGGPDRPPRRQETAPTTRPTPPQALPLRAVPATHDSQHGEVVLRRRRHVRGQLRELLDRPKSGLAPIRAATADADFTMVNLESAITTGGTRDPKHLEDARPSATTFGPARRRSRRCGRPALMPSRSPTTTEWTSAPKDWLTPYESRADRRCRCSASAGIVPRRSLPPGDAEGPAVRLLCRRRVLPGEHRTVLASRGEVGGPRRRSWCGPLRPAGRRQQAAAAGAAAVVYLHWGKEKSTAVTGQQMALARALARAGAAVVVGTHVHRLQGAGWLGSTYVAYGLGNFIWYHGHKGRDRAARPHADGGARRRRRVAAGADPARGWSAALLERCVCG